MWLEVQEPRATWQAAYGIASTDPRNLEATDEDVLRDLLVRMYQHASTHDERDQVKADAERDVAELGAEQEALRDFLRRAKIGERVRALMHGPVQPIRRIASIRGSFSTGGRTE